MQLLNIELQKNVIDFFNEVKSISNEVMHQAMTRVLQDENAIPVGYERNQNQTIHLGHGIWLKKSTYDAVVLNARTPAILVKNIAVAVFGTSVLVMSSVTGTASNRLKKGQPKENVKARPKLNSIKMMAISAIFQHWLTKKGFEKVEIDFHVSKFGNMISHKISDLNRPVQKINKSTVDVIRAETGSELDEEEVDPPDDRNKSQFESDSSVGSSAVISEGVTLGGDGNTKEDGGPLAPANTSPEISDSEVPRQDTDMSIDEEL